HVVITCSVKQKTAYESTVRLEFRRVVFRSQAEDGIRDHCVTGVQTCALPIDRNSTSLNSSHTVISYAVFCLDKKSTRLNSSHTVISYAVFCLKKNSKCLNPSHTVSSYACFFVKKYRIIQS